tara:strand:+ start:390 stop:1427 length:1038 start_codon:yes stop_codon:yes gene_type:complete
MNSQIRLATIIGATSWGTTLGILLANQGLETKLIVRSKKEEDLLNSSKENSARLSGHPFPRNLTASADIKDSLKDSDLIIIACPSHSYRENIQKIDYSSIKQTAIFVSATKGLEKETGKRMSQLFSEEFDGKFDGSFSVLSGPNLAREIAEGKPASTVIASTNIEVAELVQTIFTSRNFRVYTNSDLVGVELGGTLKNIVAIGAGLIDGIGLGNNAKSAFISRAISEISRLGIAAGAEIITFAGLACLGDVLTTCYSQLSRNRFVGEELGKGKQIDDILKNLGQVAEGVHTTQAALVLAKQLGIEMPITEQTSLVLAGKINAREAIENLMSRVPKPEDPFRISEQ